MMDKKKKIIIGVASGVAVLIAALSLAVFIPSGDGGVQNRITEEDLQRCSTALDTLQRINDLARTQNKKELTNNAQKHVEKLLEKEIKDFKGKIDYRKFSDSDFENLYNLASEIIKLPDSFEIIEHKIAKWLIEYRKWRAKNKTFSVHMGAMSACASYAPEDSEDPRLTVWCKSFVMRGENRVERGTYSAGSGTHRLQIDSDVPVSWEPKALNVKIDEIWQFCAKVKNHTTGNSTNTELAVFDYQFYPGLEVLPPLGNRFGVNNHNVMKMYGKNVNAETHRGGGTTITISDFIITGEPFLKWLEKNKWPVE